jgi:hypothetical protein
LFGLELVHFFLAHDFDDLAYMASGFLEQLVLLPEKPDEGIEQVALGLEPHQVLCLAVDGQLQIFHLRLVV